MRSTIVIPNGVRDLTNPRASRKLAAVLTISTPTFLAVCAAQDDSARFLSPSPVWNLTSD